MLFLPFPHLLVDVQTLLILVHHAFNRSSAGKVLATTWASIKIYTVSLCKRLPTKKLMATRERLVTIQTIFIPSIACAREQFFARAC
jgi:hypothetical protein